ncbi:hypothetical protein DVH05_010070 [Phytophthora capsici]|nr:hypothetical protein DVH05_010070 [Phytophthora capsici]
MRFFMIAAVAAFAFASSCETAIAEAPNAFLIDDNTNAVFSRYLRSTQTDSEERAIAQVLESEDRAVANVMIKYKSLYRAKITPKQAKLMLGVSDDVGHCVPKMVPKLPKSARRN